MKGLYEKLVASQLRKHVLMQSTHGCAHGRLKWWIIRWFQNSRLNCMRQPLVTSVIWVISHPSVKTQHCVCRLQEITAIMLPRGLGLFDDPKLVACWLFVLDNLLAQSAGASANSSCFDVGDVAMFHIWDPHSWRGASKCATCQRRTCRTRRRWEWLLWERSRVWGLKRRWQGNLGRNDNSLQRQWSKPSRMEGPVLHSWRLSSLLL